MGKHRKNQVRNNFKKVENSKNWVKSVKITKTNQIKKGKLVKNSKY